MKTFRIKPHVTDLTDLLNKPALLSWANKIGLQGISLSESRNRSMAAGTSYHKQIENFLAHGWTFESEAFQGAFVKFFEDKEILSFEKSVSTELFTGRLDIKFKHNGTTIIADFKTKQTGIYIENKLQLAAYRMAEGCDSVAIISVPSMVLIPVAIADFAPYEKCLELLAEIYAIKSKL